MTSIFAIVSFLLLIAYVGLILYYRYGWIAIRASNNAPSPIALTRISVIIPARNEEDFIGPCLEAIFNQNYPADLFEVIVVDDHSTDQTARVIQSFARPNLHYLALADFVPDAINSYKKKAIEIAIERSSGDLVVTTDADCWMGPGWLSSIAAFYEQGEPAFIAAPVAIDCGPRFIEIFQALDFMTLQGITGAAVSKNMHSMCNGANLVYEKKAFYEVGGFSGIDSIASGDDMLLMHKISQLYPGRVGYLKDEAAIVHTAPALNLRSFLNQRIRWASKADKYDDKSLLPVLVVVYFFNVLMFVLPVLAIFENTQFTIVSLNFSLLTYWFFLLVMKTLVELAFLLPVASFFNKRPLLGLFPLMQPFHILYTSAAGWLGKFGTYQWKDRKVK
ncbi:MAG: glycosyltransferase [Ferruginibacter sp.]|nr:glycosyltransferase [Ferruginibacter sp.]